MTFWDFRRYLVCKNSTYPESEQKCERVITSDANFALFSSNKKIFLGRFLTADELWNQRFCLESKVQNKKWRHLGPPLAVKIL